MSEKWRLGAAEVSLFPGVSAKKSQFSFFLIIKIEVKLDLGRLQNVKEVLYLHHTVLGKVSAVDGVEDSVLSKDSSDSSLSKILIFWVFFTLGF